MKKFRLLGKTDFKLKEKMLCTYPKTTTFPSEKFFYTCPRKKRFYGQNVFLYLSDKIKFSNEKLFLYLHEKQNFLKKRLAGKLIFYDEKSFSYSCEKNISILDVYIQMYLFLDMLYTILIIVKGFFSFCYFVIFSIFYYTQPVSVLQGYFYIAHAHIFNFFISGKDFDIFHKRFL